MQSYEILQLPTRQARRRLYEPEIKELEKDLTAASSLAGEYQGTNEDRMAARMLLNNVTNYPYGLNSLIAVLSSKSRKPLARVMPFRGMGEPPTVMQGLVDSYKNLMERGEDPIELSELRAPLYEVMSVDGGLDAIMYGLR